MALVCANWDLPSPEKKNCRPWVMTSPYLEFCPKNRFLQSLTLVNLFGLYPCLFAFTRVFYTVGFSL